MRACIVHTPDRPLVEAFLEWHAESSMILRGNLRDAGIEDDGSRYAVFGRWDSSELRLLLLA
jgi:hypothetical protein